MVNDNTVTCGDCGGFVAVQDAEGLWKAAMANHRRFCTAQRQKPASSLQQIPRPITTTTKETPMEAVPNRRPPLADLIAHDDPKVARLAAKAYDAMNALDAALADYNGKAAARARVAELEKQLAEAKAALRGKPTTKPAPQAAPAKVDYRAVRAWAEANGYDVPKVGRISDDAYDEAMRGGAA